MGDVQRIFYYHVPSAWTAFCLFFVNSDCVGRLSDLEELQSGRVGAVSAEVGVVFCTIVLVTGPIWARPVWGIWWTWDVRLTTTLVLWLIYVSYLVLRRFSDSAQTPVAGRGAGHLRGARCAAGLFLDLVFSHAASAAGDRWRRIARSAHVARAPDQLAGVFLLRRAWSAGRAIGWSGCSAK